MYQNKSYNWSHWDHQVGNQHRPSMYNAEHHSNGKEPIKYPPHTDHDMVEIHDVELEYTRWSWCSTGWSCFVFTFCCPWFGLLGLMYSLLSYSDHKSRDYKRASHKRSCAWGWTIAGLVLGLLFVAGIITLVILVYSGILLWSNILRNYTGIKL